MTVEIKVEGLDRLIAKLGRLRTFSALRAPLVRGVSVLHEAIATYPPPPPNSTYVRTGTLGRRWTTKVQTLTTFRGTIGNNTVYAPDVQDAAKQRPIHRGRWQTIQSVVSEKRGEILADFQAAINRLLGE